MTIATFSPENPIDSSTDNSSKNSTDHLTNNWAVFVYLILAVTNVIAVISGILLLMSDGKNWIVPTLILFLTGPGSAISQYLKNMGNAERWTITISVSMATSVAVAQALMTLDMLKSWPATLTLTLITAAGLPGVFMQLRNLWSSR